MYTLATKTNLITTTKVIFLALLLGIGIQFIQAWTAPSGAAPANNVSGPLTAGLNTVYQTRSMGLGLTGSVNVSNIGAQNNAVTSPKFCLNNTAGVGAGDNCITTWPTGGGGGNVKAWVVGSGNSLIAGSGILSVQASGLNEVVRLSPAMSSSNYAVVCNSTLGTGAEEQIFAYNKTPTQFLLSAAHAAGQDAVGPFNCIIVEGNGSASGDNLGNHTATQNINMSGSQVTNLSAPVNATDAATKQYVDSFAGGGGGFECYCSNRHEYGYWLSGTDTTGNSKQLIDGWVCPAGNVMCRVAVGGGSGDNLGNQIADDHTGLDMNNTTIFNVSDPISAQDAATKGYVDGKVGVGGIITPSDYKAVFAGHTTVTKPTKAPGRIWIDTDGNVFVYDVVSGNINDTMSAGNISTYVPFGAFLCGPAGMGSSICVGTFGALTRIQVMMFPNEILSWE